MIICHQHQTPMNKDVIKNLLNAFKRLSLEEREKFLSTISMECVPSDEKHLLDIKFADGAHCPFCSNHTQIIKYGKSNNGKQRYKCKNCNKFFTVTSQSVIQGTHKSIATWKKYISCMMSKMTIRQCAEECNISVRTAFIWRHKILHSLEKMMNEVKLTGVVEADETFFPLSFKGNHKKSNFTMPRRAHKRGKSIRKRGLSREQVCVPCAVNRNGLSVSKITNLGRASTKAISTLFNGVIDSSSVLCTDSLVAYDTFSRNCNIKHVKVAPGFFTNGVYNIQRVNNYHSRLKNFMNRFNGVSTKHLNNYLLWHNFVNFAKETIPEKSTILFKHMLNENCFLSGYEISEKCAVPVVA